MKDKERYNWDLFIRACKDVKVNTTILTDNSLLWYLWKAGWCSSESALKLKIGKL